VCVLKASSSALFIDPFFPSEARDFFFVVSLTRIVVDIQQGHNIYIYIKKGKIKNNMNINSIRKITHHGCPKLLSNNSMSSHRFFSSVTSSTPTPGSRGVVVLGSGWGGFNLAINAKKDLPLTIVSPNNHFLFTPLLASSAVGTLEFRCIQEPVRTVLGPEGKFVQATAKSLDPENKKLICETAFKDVFELEYDKLVIAVGVKTNVSQPLYENIVG
jgi:hypothetical protein